jgi:hypothetical protein
MGKEIVILPLLNILPGTTKATLFEGLKESRIIIGRFALMRQTRI